MKNSITCKNCSAENPPYAYICSNCGAFLRSRVHNIDLIKTTSKLIEAPSQAFKNIIFAEHKNFIFVILFLLSIRFLIDARFISLISIGEFQSEGSLIVSLLLVLAAATIFLILFSWLLELVWKSLQIETRIKDNFSILIYALLPNIFALIFLFPLEVEVFGQYLFSVNPTPFVIKGTIAYLFAGAEIAIKVWIIFLIYKAFKVQTESFLISVFSTSIFIFCMALLFYFLSTIIFTL